MTFGINTATEIGDAKIDHTRIVIVASCATGAKAIRTIASSVLTKTVSNIKSFLFIVYFNAHSFLCPNC